MDCKLFLVAIILVFVGATDVVRSQISPTQSQEPEPAYYAERDRDETTTKKAKFLFQYSEEYDPPTLTWVPPGLTFTCKDKAPGYYSDPEAKCQAYHLCMPDGRRYTMLCGIGTVFNQRTFVCDHWYNYPCANAVADYRLNEELWENVLLPHSSGRKSRAPENKLNEEDASEEK